VLFFSIESISAMTRLTRRWFRPGLLLMLALCAQVPACEYGQHQNQDGGTTGYRMSLAEPPQQPQQPIAAFDA